MSKVSYIEKLVSDLEAPERRDLLKKLLTSTHGLKTDYERYMLALMADYTASAKLRYEQFGKMQGLSTGYKSLDAMTLGLVPGELIVVAGKTSRGKTTLAVNIASSVATKRKTVLFVTMEMTHAELTARFMKINGGSEADPFHEVAAHIAYQKELDLNWSDIRGLIKKAKQELDIELVVIDHLHYFTRELVNVAEDLGRITKEFKAAAIEQQVAVILISHVRKTQNEAEATADDLRGSSYIGQDADIILMVGRHENDWAINVRIEKNRNRGFDSKNSTVALDFDGTKLTEPLDPAYAVFPQAS